MPSITFLPWKKFGESKDNETLLDTARRIGIPIHATCGGKKACGKCKVHVETAEGPLPPPTDREKELLGDLVHQGYRLACDTAFKEDCIVRVPRESQVDPAVILTSATAHPYATRLRPNVTQYHVEVPRPILNGVVPDRERLLAALTNTYAIKPPAMDPWILRKLPRALRSEQRGATASVWSGKEIVDLRPGRPGNLAGMAFDIGTTTVVGYLLNLHTGERIAVQSAMNPQIPFGDDVISRIAMCQERPGGLERLRSSIVDCVNGLIHNAVTQGGMEPSDVLEATVVGNTAMNHLFMGLDPRYLAMAPYPPVLQASQDIKARDLGIQMAESAYLHLMPLKAGFVGSDTIAAVLATAFHKSKRMTLLIDLGTNGEIVVGNKKHLACCSTAAGPAFEGGHIRWGMRAAPGAIERVTMDPRTLDVQVTTIGQVAPVGLCGSGIISAVAEMIRKGIVLHRGNFNEDIRTPRLRKGREGMEFVLVWSSEGGTEKDIVITQRDVSELQMAKSAIHSGAIMLTDMLGGERIDQILLAGAFGNYVDPEDARTIDLLPERDPSKMTGVGNAAGYGACLALLDRFKRREAERISHRMEYRELAGTERFQELFVSHMAFPSAIDYTDDF